MKRTNSKEVKQAIRNYLIENNEETLPEIRQRFLHEYGREIARRGELNACIEWLRGLSISCAFYYWDIASLLAQWLDDTEDHQIEYIDKKGDGLDWLLLAREIVAAK